MDSIKVTISEFEQTLLSAGLSAVLSSIADIAAVNHCREEKTLASELGSFDTQILFTVIRGPLDLHYEMIERVRVRFPRLPIIAVAPQASREMLYKIIKCGANGFLSADATRQEVLEAVYSVRAGHDYYCASVTALLVSNYTEAIRRDQGSSIKAIEVLSKREREILELWGDGKTNPEIADALFISTRTVESHKNHIMQKLKVRSTVDLFKFAVRNSIIPL